MLFQKKKTLSRQELEAQVFQVKCSLRRILDKYHVMLERELRLARAQRSSGIPRPSNYERLRMIAGLVSTAQRAYENLDQISTADELSRTTKELSAALGSLNRIAAASERTDPRGLRRGIKQMQAHEASFAAQSLDIPMPSDAELERLWDDVLYDKPAPTTHAPEDPMDEDLKAQLDDINRHLDSVLEDF